MEQNIQKPQTVTVSVHSRNPSSMLNEESYEAFILWSSMPESERAKRQLETVDSLAQHLGVSDRTIRRWRKRTDYLIRLREKRLEWAAGKTGDVIEAIYKTAKKGNPLSQSLWMQIFEGYDPKGKKQDDDGARKVELSMNDIRFLIEQLPENLKQKYYGFLRDLLEDTASVEHARDVEIETYDGGGAERPTDAVLREADNDAPHVPDEKPADGLPVRHSFGLCENLGRKVPAYHNQSAAWWREE